VGIDLCGRFNCGTGLLVPFNDNYPKGVEDADLEEQQ
jgi:hypothetical protein